MEKPNPGGISHIGPKTAERAHGAISLSTGTAVPERHFSYFSHVFELFRPIVGPIWLIPPGFGKLGVFRTFLSLMTMS